MEYLHVQMLSDVSSYRLEL